MKKTGFTLIELVVVVGVLGVILIAMSTILINSVRTKNRTSIIQDLEINGNMILNKIKYNLINAIPESIICSVDGKSITFVDKMGVGESTALICSEGAGVASESAKNGRLDLNADSVMVSGCDSFINCTTSPIGVEAVSVRFTLAAGNTGTAVNSVSRDFSTSVTVRR